MTDRSHTHFTPWADTLTSTDTLNTADTAPTPSIPAVDLPPIAMIAMDLDGTILEAGEHIRPEVIAALTQLTAQGVRCVTATGRQADFQFDLFARYEMDPASGNIMQALIGDERNSSSRGMASTSRTMNGTTPFASAGLASSPWHGR